MGIYDHAASDIELWKNYLQFHLRCGSGLWSPALITRPYGTVQFGEAGDWGDLLWQAQLQPGWTATDIVDDVEKLSQRNVKKPGFYFNPSFDRDTTEQLQKILPQRGYAKTYEIRWMCLEQFPAAAPTLPDGLTITDAQTAAPFLEIMHDAFPEYHGDAVFQNNIPVAKSAVHVRHLLLQNSATDATLGINAIAWENEFGYLFCLGVRATHRRQGLGKLLVDWSLSELRKIDVRFVVAGVLADNDASYALQLQQGYRQFASAECWLPRDMAY